MRPRASDPAGTFEARRLAGDVRGASLVEYIIAVGLIALVALVGFRMFGQSVDAKIRCFATEVMGNGSCTAGAANGVNAGSGQAVSGTDGQTKGAAPPSNTDADNAGGLYPGVPSDIVAAAKSSPTLQHSLDVLFMYSVKSEKRVGGGSLYNADSNKMILDENRASVFDLVHEVNHAEYANARKRPEVNALSRDAWIDAMLNEEAEGDARGTQAVYQLKQAGNPLGQMMPAHQFEYDAFVAGLEKARRDNPGASEKDLEAAGYEAARAEIRKALESGKLVQSIDGRRYAIRYGEWWDKAHPTANANANPPSGSR